MDSDTAARPQTAPVGPSPEVLTVAEAAELLRINEKTLREAITRDEVPGVRRIGRVIPKGGRSRTVDMPASVTTLKAQPRQLRSPWVFADEKGEAFSVKQFNMALDAATEAAGIVRDTGRIGWHDLRHTYGSHLAMRGVQLKVIQELMGHATIEMTMRYAHLSPEVKRVAVEVLDHSPAGPHTGHMQAVGQ